MMSDSAAVMILRLLPRLGLLVAALTAPGCGNGSSSPTTTAFAEAGGADDSPPPQPPLAFIEERSVRREHLEPLLLEAAGGIVLEEVVLDRVLESRCAEAEIRLGRGDLVRERNLLLEELDPADPDRAVLLLDRLRARRGLGPRRFDLLLRRNAMLRALVADDVRITDEQLQRRHAYRFGPRYRVRVVSNPDRALVLEAREQAESGAHVPTLAAEYGADISAQRGGLLDAVSPLDERYPEVMRRQLAVLEPGTVSPVFRIDNGFAFMVVEARIEPTAEPPPLDEVRDELETEIRRDRERFLMDSLAESILLETDVVVADPALGTSWRQRLRDRR